MHDPDVIQPLLMGAMVVASLLSFIQRLGRVPMAVVVILALSVAAYPRFHSALLAAGAFN